nr:hypothetical protein HmN_000545400 [Hymenolepis microstoma]
MGIGPVISSLTAEVSVIFVPLATLALASAQLFCPVPVMPTPVVQSLKKHQTAVPLKLTVTPSPMTVDPVKTPHHPSVSFFLAAMSGKISKCIIEPKPGQEIIFITWVLVAVASTSVFSSSLSESKSKSGSMSSFGGPQRDPTTHTIRELDSQQKKRQDPQGGGRFSDSDTLISPIAALLRGKMEMCGHYAKYGDIDECVDCILDEDKKLKNLKKLKAKSFCYNLRYLPL